MKMVKLTVTESSCRSGYHKRGDEFLVSDLCPPICHELWYAAYPYVFALLNGSSLDCGEEKSCSFDVCCPDGGRVRIHGEIIGRRDDIE